MGLYENRLTKSTGQAARPSVGADRNVEGSSRPCSPKARTVRDFYKRLNAKGKPAKVCLVACMHKLLTILSAMVKNKTRWSARFRNKPLDMKHSCYNGGRRLAWITHSIPPAGVAP